MSDIVILVITWITEFNHAAKMTAKDLQADWSEMGKIVQLNVKMAWPPWRPWSCTRLNSYLSGVVMFKWTTTPTRWSSSCTTPATSSRPSPGTEKHLLSPIQLAFNPRGCQLFQLVPRCAQVSSITGTLSTSSIPLYPSDVAIHHSPLGLNAGLKNK